MPEEFSIHVSGIEEIYANLDTLPTRVIKYALAKALAAAAVPVIEALRARTPVRETPGGKDAMPPGFMLRSLMSYIEIDKDGRGGSVQVGYGRQGAVARLVEYGHRIIAHGATREDRKLNYLWKKLGDVPPHPFMRPAAAESLDEAIYAFCEALSVAIDEAGAGMTIQQEEAA